MNKKIRILVVDDNQSFCKGMRALLEIQPDMEVAGEGHNGHIVMGLVEELHPDVILLDAQMPGMTGVEVTRIVKNHSPQVKVILMTMFADYRPMGIEAGADAFLTKGIPPEHILSLIRGIAHP